MNMYNTFTSLCLLTNVNILFFLQLLCLLLARENHGIRLFGSSAATKYFC